MGLYNTICQEGWGSNRPFGSAHCTGAPLPNGISYTDTWTQKHGASAPHPRTIRNLCTSVSHLSDTDRCETKDTRLGGGLFDPTTRDKTAPATCVLEDTPIDRTYQPQCRLKKDPPPPESNTLAPEFFGRCFLEDCNPVATERARLSVSLCTCFFNGKRRPT